MCQGGRRIHEQRCGSCGWQGLQDKERVKGRGETHARKNSMSIRWLALASPVPAVSKPHLNYFSHNAEHQLHFNLQMRKPKPKQVKRFAERDHGGAPGGAELLASSLKHKEKERGLGLQSQSHSSTTFQWGPP